MKTLPLKLTLCLIILIGSLECKSLNKYVIKCSLKNKEDFSKCAVEAGTSSFHQFIHGDKNLKIPDLDPLRISSLELNSAGLKLKITNVTVEGIRNSVINSVSFDKHTNVFHMESSLSEMTIQGIFTIDGKILIVPIKGEGEATLKFLDGLYIYDMHLSPVTKNGKETIKVDNPKLKTEFGGATFEVSSLFKGNEQLANQMNKFLNDNWSEIVKEFDSLVVTPIIQVASGIFGSILNGLTYDEVFEDL